MYLSLSLSLSLYLSLSLSFFWSGHVPSSPWSNVSRVTSLWGHSVVVFLKGRSLSEWVSQSVSDKVTYWAVGWTAKNIPNFRKCQRIEKIVKIVTNCQKHSKLTKIVWFVKIVWSFQTWKNCQTWNNCQKFKNIQIAKSCLVYQNCLKYKIF